MTETLHRGAAFVAGAEMNPLRQRQLARKIDGVGLSAHVALPAIASALASAARLLFAAEGAADILGDPHKYRPDSKETADHSLPYCMAAGLVDGMVTPLQFKEERVLDKALIPIMDKVKVVANEEFEALFPKFQPSRVTITTNDGKSHSTRVDVPKGDPRDPMTEDEIAVKFTALGGNVIGKDQCKKLQKFIMSMETADKLDKLFELTTAG